MGRIEELIDSSLTSRSPGDQMLKLIHIGLLCIQDNPTDRPAMSTVNTMLRSNTVTLQSPSIPTFCIQESDANNLYVYSEPDPRSPGAHW